MSERPLLLLTGASGAIGSAIARRLADGWDFLLHGRDASRLAALAEELEARGARSILWVRDLSRTEGLAAELSARPEFSWVRAYVHAAGQPLYRLLADTTEEEWDALFHVHVRSIFLIARRLIPSMVRRREGRMVFLSSVWGESGAAGEAAYAAAKGAVHALVRSLARELAPSGIAVNGVAPGVVHTPMLAPLGEEGIRQTLAEIPLGRAAEPDEVAAAVAFLLAPESRHITGHILTVHGGWR
ncbi:elongation factor P 5-aminopentanone reductase [Brockia lithotrophica]|uniref:3-oxoacyl-[acyl-carrier protein] reductase n=1 Tax=Brockia lithotrophica TaxID=933949 RepID=A0A660L4Y1_9BACL|nr:SDR family oxidoreductase [Brockia lithotrophica]RKQ88375.1 3-oxoacyl-[acyl-carrier protein] reductase [Brockia lithotrophica]